MYGLKEIILIILTTFVFTVVLVPFVKRIAFHIGAVAKRNNRTVHKHDMPQMGGLTIFFGLLFGYMLFSKLTIEMNAILIGSFTIIIPGIFDDIKPLPPFYKFFGQLL
jgi:UDP-GlcNAc:undecaprenyl-phosphate GlcNAc-1-phosphate transferase